MIKEIYTAIKYYGLLDSMRYAYQRIRYGYDERIGWDLSNYFEKFLNPLQLFLTKQLENEIKFDKKREKIYNTTLDLILEYKLCVVADERSYEKYTSVEKHCEIEKEMLDTESKMWKYIGEHIGWYWD